MVSRSLQRHVLRGWRPNSYLRLCRTLKSPRVLWCTPRFESPYATFSSTDEIDLITLRRRSVRKRNSDVNVPFRTALDSSASLNGLYDPCLVEQALSQVTLKSGRGSDSARSTMGVADFVRRFNTELHVFSDFVRKSYFMKIKNLALLSPKEVSNILYIFRDRYHKGKVTGIDSGNMALFDAMVMSFLALLAVESNPPVPAAVTALLDGSKLYYVDLYSSGIGNFLPELRILAAEFDFQSLASVRPVLDKILVLVSELSRFLKEHNEPHHYDTEFFRVVIHVLRYKKLQDILETVAQKNISPKDLLALTKDPDAGAVQKLLAKSSAESEKLDDLVFVQNRNLLNVVYSTVGLLLFDVIFARLYLEAEKPGYSEAEKALIDRFVETFLPLVCGGLLSIDALLKVKYSCLPARYNGRVLIPYKVSDNIFRNYEFSLAMLYDIPAYFHLVSAARKSNDFAECSFEEIALTIKSAAKGSQLLQDDASVLLAALKDMSSYTVLGFSILDVLAKDLNLLRVAQAHDSYHNHETHMQPEVVDLSLSLESKKEPSNSSIRINNLELADFTDELSAFKRQDLAGFPYSYLSDKTVLRYLGLRITDVVSKDIVRDGSAVTPETVTPYANLMELISATFDINGGSTEILDKLAKDAPEPPKEYFQIPDHLMVHNFCAELEILKTDELQSSFRNFTAEQVLSLLQRRILELSKKLPSSNKASRMNVENLSRFTKLASILQQLFDSNNGNTEVLDAVLRSQSVLQQLESRLANKQKANDESQANLYATGPYMQIPDEMQLHDFVEELKIFKQDDLRSSYKNFSAEKVLSLMQKRIKEIYSDLPSTNLALRMSKKNLVAFIKLHAKLEKLLAWNGGNTSILDTLIDSQAIFDSFEAKLSSKVAEEKPKENVYRQIPDDMVLEDYFKELLAIKEKLRKDFGSSTPDEILKCLQLLSDAETSTEVKVIYGKLARNLIVLFKHNNDETFVLDNVLLNASAFNKFEDKLTKNRAADNKFVMSDFLDKSQVDRTPLEYHSEDYVLSLFNSNNTPAEFDTKYAASEASIKAAVSESRSKEESKLFEDDPEEYAELQNLTAEKIRDSYAKKRLAKCKHAKHKLSHENSSVKPVDKESLEKFLKNTKRESDLKAENKLREQKAYEWSSNMIKSSRTLESGDFFNPMFKLKSRRFPMFPSTKVPTEYLVLTTSSQTFVSKENPLGSNHITEDMFAVLNRFDEGELEKFSKNVKKLQKKNWKLIGGGGNERMLVMSRPLGGGRSKIWTRIKTLLASTGVVFLTLVGLNIWLDDQQAAPVLIPESEVMRNIRSVPIPSIPVESIPVDSVQPTLELARTECQSPSSKPSSLWKRLLWRE